jgi:hypothetical protein
MQRTSFNRTVLPGYVFERLFLRIRPNQVVLIPPKQ